MWTDFLVLVLAFATVLYVWGRRKRPKNFPPGPSGLPLIGALPLLGKYPYLSLTKLKPKFGPIIGFDSILGTRAVGISDYKLLKEATNEPAFAGRPKLQFMADRSGGEPEGIVFTEGQKWQEQKRFTLRRLRDFGFGTRSMEAIVQEEIQELVERFKAEVGKPISTQNRFNGAVINALWTIVAGERFRQDDPKVNEIFRLFTQDLSSIDFRAMLSVFIPAIAKYFPDWVSGSSKLMGPVGAIQELIRRQIDSHIISYIQGQPRDFIDTYIDEIKSTQDPTSSFHSSKYNTFVFTIIDLFMAGGETTSTTLTWIFLFLARHRHVQEKLHSEIERVVGNSRSPSLADRSAMPYTEAVIHEVLRMRPLFPATMQRTTEDIPDFHGYYIPKDTAIFLNLNDAHYDPELWGDPDNFRPERFLSNDESKFVHHEGILTFSAGKRVCLGERLARDELFLFTVGLLQAFEVNWDPSGTPPSLECTTVGLMMPAPHKLVLSVRQGQ